MTARYQTNYRWLCAYGWGGGIEIRNAAIGKNYYTLVKVALSEK
ncbi:hypothetical protein [[Phormidium] sp. ETS-05]|nr:hypothetical protein [[Phormidium] sp. ETS-05]